MRYLASELLTCFSDAAEALFSTLTCLFRGDAKFPQANFAIVALQSLAWCQQRVGGGGGEDADREEWGQAGRTLVNSVTSFF